MPKASIITSVYNGEKFLVGFFENVLRQSCIDDVEIVILDACSNDSSSEIISNFSHPSIKYTLLGERLPVTETMNLAIDKAESEILTFWNVDDRRNSSSLERQIQYMNTNPDCDISYGRVAWSFIENQTFEENSLTEIYPSSPATKESLLINNSPNCLPLWRKSLHDELGYFNTEYGTASDYEFWMRCLTHNKRFDQFFEVVGSYYYNPQGLSTCANSKNAQESHAIREKYVKLWNS